MGSIMCLTRFIARLTLVSALATAPFAFAQADLWSHVSPQAGPQRLEPVALTDAQLKSFASLLHHQKQGSIWDCEGADLDEMIKGLRFESIPMPGKQEVALAEAPAGCARGGQGANGAMWLIRFDGARATLLATPDSFDGWLFAVLPTTSHGYPDIVTGWHMSAFEAVLSYMRFDGKSYRSISGATLESNGGENVRIVPASR
jgi:hypothetical protein